MSSPASRHTNKETWGNSAPPRQDEGTIWITIHGSSYLLLFTHSSSAFQSLFSAPFTSYQRFFLNFSLIPQFHGSGGVNVWRGKRERERQGRARAREEWWKPKSKTGKLIFFFGTLLLVTASGTEYKLINLPGCTCDDTRSKPGIRYGCPAPTKSTEMRSPRKHVWE